MVGRIASIDSLADIVVYCGNASVGDAPYNFIMDEIAYAAIERIRNVGGNQVVAALSKICRACRNQSILVCAQDELSSTP